MKRSLDSFFAAFTCDQMIRLYLHRVGRLEYFEKKRMPDSVIESQRALVRQARRILHRRGIENPERPLVRV